MSTTMTDTTGTSTTSPELLAKILLWGRENFPDYVENPKLITALYNDKHTASEVSECRGGARAALTLLFVREYDPSTYQACSKCNKKQCKCGEEAYTEQKNYAYLAGDKTGNIMVKIPPWCEGEKPATEKVYRVEGNVQEYNQKLSLNAKKITAVTVAPKTAPKVESKETAKPKTEKQKKIEPQKEDVPPADEALVAKGVDSVKNILTIFDGAISDKKLTEVLAKQGFKTETVATIVQVAIAKGVIKAALVGENEVAYSTP